MVAVTLVAYIVMSSGEKKPIAAPDDGLRAIQVTSSNLVTKQGSTQPKVVLSL